MIIVVCGPTASGKTKLSIDLAKKYNGIIVNADSMQVYKGLDIATAKIKDEEKEGISHYLFDIANIDDMYTVYDYQKDLREILDNNQDKNIIIVGGTGLYIKAGLYNYEFNCETSFNTYDDKTNEELYKLVKEKFPDIDIHVNNRKRLIRALNKTDDYSNKGDELLYPAIFIGLDLDRDFLYERINKRVDIMFEEGVLKEAKDLYDKKVYSKSVMTGIGYKELYEYFDGNISLDEAKDLIKKNTRHYAKRQMTWFKNKMDIKWFKLNENNYQGVLKEVEKYIEKD